MLLKFSLGMLELPAPVGRKEVVNKSEYTEKIHHTLLYRFLWVFSLDQGFGRNIASGLLQVMIVLMRKGVDCISMIGIMVLGTRPTSPSLHFVFFFFFEKNPRVAQCMQMCSAHTHASCSSATCLVPELSRTRSRPWKCMCWSSGDGLRGNCICSVGGYGPRENRGCVSASPSWAHTERFRQEGEFAEVANVKKGPQRVFVGSGLGFDAVY